MSLRNLSKRTLIVATIGAIIIVAAVSVTIGIVSDKGQSSPPTSANIDQKKAQSALLAAGEFPAREVSKVETTFTDHAQAVAALQAYVDQVSPSDPTCKSRLADLLDATIRATSSTSASANVDLLGGIGNYTLTVTLNAVPLRISQLPYSDTCSNQVLKEQGATSQVRLQTTPLEAPGWMTSNQIKCDCYQQVSSFEPPQAGATAGYKLYGAIMVGTSKVSVESSTNSASNPVSARIIQQFESVLERLYLKATAPASSLK